MCQLVDFPTNPVYNAEMPDKRFQVRLQGESGLPQDVFENVLYFFTDDEETVADGLADLYDGALFLAGWKGIQIRSYDLSGGQPTFQKDYPNAQAAASLSCPSEVAICLSYATVDNPEASTPRRRGRIYLGPLRYQEIQSDRPTPTLRGQVLDFGAGLAQIGTGTAQTWKLYSKTDGQTADIESIWVDDAWDTQRRRGLEPTLRETRDVQ